jgi:hypothetical protein
MEAMCVPSLLAGNGEETVIEGAADAELANYAAKCVHLFEGLPSRTRK